MACFLARYCLYPLNIHQEGHEEHEVGMSISQILRVIRDEIEKFSSAPAY